MSSSNSPTPKDDVSAESRSLRRRQKAEAHLTSGCGFGKEKRRLVDGFWTNMWPGLTKLGWTKIEGTGTKQWVVYFVPNGADPADENAVNGEHYFDRIRDVIDHVLGSSASPGERSIGEMFEKEVMGESEPSEITTRTTRRSANNLATPIDLSWKDGGTSYPKASSRVGTKYQVPSIPEAGSFCLDESKEDPDLQCDLIWDPARAQAAGVLDYIQESIRFNKKEACLAVLHEHKYQLAKARSALDEIKVKDGSDWTDEQKQVFHSEMFRLRKNLVDVARTTGVCNNVTYTYYLAKFKKSNDYRLLKSICEEERMEKFAASDQGLDACGICGDGGSLLICDGCEGEYHMTCLHPPLVEIPEGAWFCDTCVDSNFLEARDKVIHQFYVEIGDELKKRKVDEIDTDDSNPTIRKTKSSGGDIILRPSETVLNAVKALASCIAHALTPS